MSRAAAIGALIGLVALFLLGVLAAEVSPRPADQVVEWEEPAATAQVTVRPIREVPQDPMPAG